MKLFLSLTLSFLLLSALAAPSVQAIDVPNFPACKSYNGTPKVSYSTGVHGIPGLSGEYIGSDVVYTVGDGNLIQCFCAASGSGIQTNWWKQESLSESQITTLKNLGWIYIPSGEPWGLENSVYFAQNTNYNCGSSSTTTSSGGGSAPVCDSAKPGTPTLVSVTRNAGSATLVWTPVANATHYTIGYGLNPNTYIYGVPNTGNVTNYTINALDPNTTYYFAVRAVNNCMPGDWSGTSNLGGGQVLGLATTGTWLQILGALTLAVALFTLARYVRKTASK